MGFGGHELVCRCCPHYLVIPRRFLDEISLPLHTYRDGVKDAAQAPRAFSGEQILFSHLLWVL